jgi:hypothetical protein
MHIRYVFVYTKTETVLYHIRYDIYIYLIVSFHHAKVKIYANVASQKLDKKKK